MNIPKEMLENRAFTSDAAAFNLQMTGSVSPKPYDPEADRVPIAIEVLPDGSTLCKFYAPTAKSVSVGHMRGDRVELTLGEQGIWSGILPSRFPGVKVISWRVDGVDVLNPYAPIGYGFGHPVNYIDIPCPEQDYLMIKDVPHGFVVRNYYKSTVTGETESCLVYLPPKYFEEPDRRYPVLYLQHGNNQNENGWIYEAKTNFIMDNLLAEEKAVPCIIVMNNGMVQVKNEEGKWQYGDRFLIQELLVKDCIPYIDATYRTLATAWDRAYAGLSMGSLQGGKFFMERRDVIASAGLFTGYTMPDMPDMANVQPDYLKALDDAEAFNKSVRLFFIASGLNEPAIDKVQGEHADCLKRGIHHVFKAYPGEHEWHVWRAALHDYLQLLFR